MNTTSILTKKQYVMENVSKQEVEEAIRAYKAAKIQKAEIEGAIKDAEEVIEAYSLNHIGEFADGRLPKACEAWAKATAKTNPEAIRGYIASAVPVAALTSTQTGGTSPAGTPHVAALTDEERYACAQLGMSEEDFIEAKKTEKK